jgi:hypothetical protein
MVLTLGERKFGVVIPAVREGLRREASFRAHVTGFTGDGLAFEENTVIRNLSLHGAMIYLDHSPKLQSELHVTIDSTAGPGQGNVPMRLRAYVVRIEPGPEKDQTAVGIVFTE